MIRCEGSWGTHWARKGSGSGRGSDGRPCAGLGVMNWSRGLVVWPAVWVF